MGTTFALFYHKKNAVNREETSLSEMILSYLRRHPGAGDTLEGITRWWLELERIDASVDEVADTLSTLRQEGIIKVYTSEAGLTLYRIKNAEEIIAEEKENTRKQSDKESEL